MMPPLGSRMIPTDFTVETADWSNEPDQAACRAVREAVFLQEQKVPVEDEWDSADAVSRHALARDNAGNPIGTGRLTPQRVISRMAVLADWRGREVGAAILNLLLQQARALNYTTVEMHAQSYAVPFYEKFGFARHGDEFLECGMKHFHMRLELAPAEPPKRPPPPPRPEVRLVPVTSRDEALAEVLQLLGAARKDVCIYTRDLDASLFDNDGVLEALKRLAVSGRGATVRFVVQEPRVPAQRGHRLVALAQRLSSVFAFRTPTQEEDLQYPSAFVLNDARGYYFRVLGSLYDGEAVNYAPGRHAQLQDFFNQVWERSERSDELRQLAL
jgi:predicted GNAT family N-acyltransferase